MSEQKVEAVERALSILEAFADGARHLTLGDLAQRTGLYRSTILRLCASLERFGYIRRDADGVFRLGPSLWRLGVLYQSAFDLADYVRPALAALVAATEETAAFYVRENDKRICLYRLHTQRLVRHHIEEGAALPLDRGASAHVLMAHTGGAGERYGRIRADGYCLSVGERDPETTAIAVPVFGHGGAFVGALGLTGSSSRFTEETRERLLAVLKQQADRLSHAIGGRGGGQGGGRAEGLGP